MEKLALTAIAALGIPCILARLFSLSRDDPAKTSGAFEFRDGLVTEQSKRTFDQAQSIPLILGATAGIIIASSIAGWNGSNRAILGAWIILAGQTGITLADKQTQKRSTINGAASSAVLALLLAFQLVSTSNVDTIDRAALLAGLFAAISTLYGFLSIPRQPDRFFEGKLVDRQSSGSVLETATFSWSRKLFHAQIVSKLRVTDLPALHRAVRARQLTQQHVQNARSGLVGLRVTLAKTHARALICQWALTILLQSVVGLGPRFVIFRLLQQLETTPQARDGGHTQGLFLALALGLCKVGELWISLWLRWITVSKLQIPIHATLSSLVYRKALCLPNVLGTLSGVDKANQRPRGSILTHMRLDSAKACMAYTDTNKIPMLIAKLVSTTAFLVNLIGWKSLLPGLVASVLVLPLTTMLTAKYGTAQSQQRMHRDQRVTLLKDALLAIRQLKLAAAEAAWERRIFKARKQELRQLFESAIWMCSLVFAANIGPILLAGIPIYLFALQNRKLSVPIAFTCIDLFQQLQSDFAIIPLTSTYFSEALAGLRRLESFFAEREVMRTQTTPSDTVSCQGATIAWPEDSKGQQGFVLADVSVEFPDGQLSVVTGETGSGKSLLLSALVGEAITLSGKIYSPPRANVQDVDSDYLAKEEMITKHDHGSSPHPVAIVSQAPWMDNTSIRDNVLFGLPLDQHRYRAALHSCALDADLEALKDGDATLVGLKGVVLSGGQRWRVALARALYSGAGVILMEDVLTAVDAEVREFLVEHAVCGDLAKNRTRILVTHHAAQCQARAAYMVHLHGGRIKEERQLSSITRSSLSMRAEQDLRLPLRGNVQGIVQGHREPDGTSPRIQRAAGAGDGIPKHSQDGARPPQETKATQRKRSSWSRYKVYFSATGGLRSWCFVTVVVTICEVLSFAKSWWLKDWTSHMQKGHESGHEATGGGGDTQIVFYGAVFMVLSSLTCLAMAARCFVWFVLGITASASLFESMTCAILGSSLQWLEGTPHGEIVTRFTSDINTVDQRLPHDVGYMIQSLNQVVSIILTSIFVSPSGVIFIPLLLYAYCSLGIRLISTTKALKDVSVTATSLLYDQLSSLLAPDGFLTIRTYGMSGYFLDRIFRTIDDVSSADWYHALCRIMMDLQLGMLGAVFLTSVALSAVLTEADAGTTAIALSFVMQFDKAMSSFLQRIATVEAGLDSAERIFEYSKLSGEPKSGIDPPPAWPSHGSVQVCKLVAGYHSSQDSRVVLNDISLSINPGERVGIVGRTGAGKSSLTLAFARLIHQRQGQIIIDGVDVSTIKLRALRQRLFVIPQDPYLFSGSLRSTLDPDGTFDDETLVAALRNVCFTSCSQADAEPSADLSFMLNEGGTNISQGQRQMLFLARALLSRPRIVIMDEATSGIDVETNTTIQVALRAGLPDTTVISVVHLLATIADFDKVFVLEDGALVEFGTPADLCGRKGRFWDLVCHSSDREQLVCRIFNRSSPL